MENKGIGLLGKVLERFFFVNVFVLFYRIFICEVF